MLWELWEMRAAILQLILFQISKSYHKIRENFVPTFCKGLGLSGFCKKFGLFFWFLVNLFKKWRQGLIFGSSLQPTHPLWLIRCWQNDPACAKQAAFNRCAAQPPPWLWCCDQGPNLILRSTPFLWLRCCHHGWNLSLRSTPPPGLDVAIKDSIWFEISTPPFFDFDVATKDLTWLWNQPAFFGWRCYDLSKRNAPPLFSFSLRQVSR